MNPEFRRYCWTEFTVQRLALAAVALSLTVGTAGLIGGAPALSVISLALMLMIGIGMGVPQIAKSITQEIAQRTWDWKRMSPTKPLTLVVGKLLGAPIFVLSVVSVLAAIYLFSSIATEGRVFNPLFRLIITLLFIALTYGVVLMSQLDQLNQVTVTGSRVSGFNPGIPFAVIAAFFIWKLLSFRGFAAVQIAWYGLECPLLAFWGGSLAIFVFWSIFGCYRLMRRELAYSGRPLGFLGFLLFVWIYIFGFFERYAPAELLAQTNIRVVAFFGLGCALTLTATYFNLLTEPVGQSQLLRLHQSLWALKIWHSFKFCPRWLLALILLTISMLPLGASALWFPSEMSSFISVFFASAGCFCIRDCAVYLLSKGRLRASRRDLAFFGWLVIMYLLIPIFWAALSKSSSPFTSPLFFPSWSTWGWLPPLLQAVLAGAVLWIVSKGRAEKS
jgi:hypothetical protein